MSTTVVHAHTSRLLLGTARADITPPVGIYHRLWGAARHDRATGVHRPLYADVMLLAPLRGQTLPFLRVQCDLAGLANDHRDRLREVLAGEANVPTEHVVITCSHTHSSGWFTADRQKLPGGELIPEYLQSLEIRLREAARRARESIQPVTITYATGRCDMAANRDYYDDAYGKYVCGFNPDKPIDNLVTVGRVTDQAGRLHSVIVHYGCHPTTLAWQNSLISPDYVGALREEVERSTGAACIFLLAPCGDIGPRDGFVGDLEVADRNGRQVAFAALSTLFGMGPAETDFAYQGYVISGATLGTWAHVPFDDRRRQSAERFEGGAHVVQLPLKPRPARDELLKEMARREEEQREADARGDAIAARNAGALAERARRWLERLNHLPAGNHYPFHVTILRMGDAVWITTGGEPYSVLQSELRRRFPHLSILVSPVGADLFVAYLLPRDRYGLGLYQEEPSILAPGCLEILTEAIAERIPA